ncbi:MAG: hypothetical protein LBP58_00115 [Azoarcus sp.]|nr:hypothetical protein [Azoarcus sp.]
MKVNDFFRIGRKTIFAGELYTDEKYIASSACFMKIGDDTVGEIEIAGEVSSNTGHRDLWTLSTIMLDRASIHEKDVWLISKQ